MSVAISDYELREFVKVLRDWRLSVGALQANIIGGETGRTQMEAIEAVRRKTLLDFLDAPAIDVAFEAILTERRAPSSQAAPPEGSMKGNGE